jgi:spore maturation protein CgeB
LKILVLGTPREDTAAGSIARALGAVHEVTMFDYERGFTPFSERLYGVNALFHAALRATRRQISYFSDQRLLAWAKERRFDLIVIVSINMVPPDVVSALRERTGALVIGWFTDAIVNIHGAEFIRAPYHRIFFKDKVVVDRFRTTLASGRYEYLAQAFDPALHRPVPSRFAPPEASADVATFGNSYPFRAMMMGELLDQRDIHTVIYGLPGRFADERLRARYLAPVKGLKKSAVMRAAKVALNTNHFSELGGVNKRTFELGGIGAFQLTDGPAITEYFEPDVECAVFHGPGELVEKVRYYLERPDERAEIARRGLLRAFRSHTYQHRLNEIFDRVPELRGAPRLPLTEVPPAPDDGITGELPRETHRSVAW